MRRDIFLRNRGVRRYRAHALHSGCSGGKNGALGSDRTSQSRIMGEIFFPAEAGRRGTANLHMHALGTRLAMVQERILHVACDRVGWDSSTSIC